MGILFLIIFNGKFKSAFKILIISLYQSVRSEKKTAKIICLIRQRQKITISNHL